MKFKPNYLREIEALKGRALLTRCAVDPNALKAWKQLAKEGRV